MTIELRPQDSNRLQSYAREKGLDAEEYAAAILRYCLQGFDRRELQAMVADAYPASPQWRKSYER